MEGDAHLHYYYCLQYCYRFGSNLAPSRLVLQAFDDLSSATSGYGYGYGYGCGNDYGYDYNGGNGNYGYDDDNDYYGDNDNDYYGDNASLLSVIGYYGGNAYYAYAYYDTGYYG